MLTFHSSIEVQGKRVDIKEKFGKSKNLYKINNMIVVFHLHVKILRLKIEEGNIDWILWRWNRSLANLQSSNFNFFLC